MEEGDYPCGEPAGGRTRDHLIKSQVLYQLSYRLSQEGRNLVGDSSPVNEDKVAAQDFHRVAAKQPKWLLE